MSTKLPLIESLVNNARMLCDTHIKNAYAKLDRNNKWIELYRRALAQSDKVGFLAVSHELVGAIDDLSATTVKTQYKAYCKERKRPFVLLEGHESYHHTRLTIPKQHNILYSKFVLLNIGTDAHGMWRSRGPNEMAAFFTTKSDKIIYQFNLSHDFTRETLVSVLDSWRDNPVARVVLNIRAPDDTCPSNFKFY